MGISRRSLFVASPLLLLPSCARAPEAGDITMADGRRTLGDGASATHYIHGHENDTTGLWERALGEIARLGHGHIRATGTHFITRTLRLPDVVSLGIDGSGCVLYKATKASDFSFFRSTEKRIPSRTLMLHGLRIVGSWDHDPRDYGPSARGISANNYRNLTLQNVYVEAIQEMGIGAADCDVIHAASCVVERCARDGLNFTGSRLVTVIGCTVRHCGDDGIAVHSARDDRRPSSKYGTLLSANQLEDTLGIKVLGGESISIANNIIVRPKLYGIYLGEDPSWHEGMIPHVGVSVSQNIITDIVRPEYFRSSSDINDGILLLDRRRSVTSMAIQGNIITKTRPSGTQLKYSDWGFGQLFTASGWLDLPLNQPHVGAGRGIRVCAVNAGDETEISILGNVIRGVARDSAVKREMSNEAIR